MNHADFLSSLDPATRARLTARHKTRGILHLMAHGGAIALTGLGIALVVPGWWALLPVHGVLLVFLFTLEHECTHRTPFASDRLSDIVGTLCGLVLILPFQWFRAFHLAHHRFTNLPGRDPELASPKPATLGQWAWHVSGLPYWGAALALLLRLARGREEPDYLPPRARKRAAAEARWMLAVYAVLAASLLMGPVILWVWVVPVLMGQPVLRLYLLAEHGDCPQVADMFANTRTTFTTAVVRFLAWNMPYHVEHHVYPTVPFHNLPLLHRLIRDHLQVTADGYADFTRAYLARRR
ncbi:MAG: fatty acid desaturase [Paracoccaceae bacterium]